MATSTGERPTEAITKFFEFVSSEESWQAFSRTFTMVRKKELGMYMIIVTSWGNPQYFGLYLAGYTGNNPSQSGVAPIKEMSGTTITANGAEISISMNSGAFVVYRVY